MEVLVPVACIDLAGRAPVCGLPQSSLADEDRDRVLREVRDLDRPRLAPLKERVRSALGVSCGRTDEVTVRADGHLLGELHFHNTGRSARWRPVPEIPLESHTTTRN